MEELWDHRADLAEQAILERHVSRLWGIPKTTLGMVAWPSTTRDKLFYHWHYWWQAQFLDCQVDAARRREAGHRLRRIRRTIRGIRIRNLRPLPRNEFFDDRAWLSLAFHRAERLPKYGKVRYLPGLDESILAGIDPMTGALPWKAEEHLFNVSTNGPVAIFAARSGRLGLAEQLIELIYPRLINSEGLVMDGVTLRLHGEEVMTEIYPHNQGVVLGALVELARAQRKSAGVAQSAIDEVGTPMITRVHQLVEAVANHGTTADGVIDMRVTRSNGGGDDGLAKGILARYLALVATDLPSSDAQSKATRTLARRLVMQSAESVWRHRLEVDGLPLFGASWVEDAAMPQSGGRLERAFAAGAGADLGVAERDLSVQLSGWMLMEAAARVTAH